MKNFDWDDQPYLKLVIYKMCEFAEIDPITVDFNSKTWYSDNTWTDEQELEFKEWVVDFMQHSIGARRELMRFSIYKSKKSILRWYMWFNLQWGLKTKIL